jgi:hypothetical protein
MGRPPAAFFGVDLCGPVDGRGAEDTGCLQRTLAPRIRTSASEHPHPNIFMTLRRMRSVDASSQCAWGLDGIPAMTTARTSVANRISSYQVADARLQYKVRHIGGLSWPRRFDGAVCAGLPGTLDDTFGVRCTCTGNNALSEAKALLNHLIATRYYP